MKLKLKPTFLKCLTILLAAPFFAQSVSFAGAGGGSTGGGDIDAVHFITRAVDIGQWLSTSQSPFTKTEVSNYGIVLKKLIGKMQGADLAPIRFVESTDVMDSNKVNKMAVFVSSPLSVTVSRPAWHALNSEEQYQLVALEMFGLSGFDSRYRVAGLIHNSVSLIQPSGALGPLVTETVKVVYDKCDREEGSYNPAGIVVKHCTRITATQNSVSLTATCISGDTILTATVSSPLMKKAGYSQALSRPKDEVTKDGLTCSAEITNFIDQSGFMMWSIANDNGYRMTDGFSGKNVDN